MLQSMEVSFEAKNAVADKKFGPQYQAVPVGMKRPDIDRISILRRKASHKDKKRQKRLQSWKYSQVDGITKVIDSVTNPGRVVKKAVYSSLAFNSALSLKMAGSGHCGACTATRD
ncbi:hypothetical protein Plhal304r1_c047g0129471 [Plasmopara halstedii]